MKKICTMVLLYLAIASPAAAQENGKGDTEALQQQVTELSNRLSNMENENREQQIWKRRSKYFNLGYDIQTISLAGEKSKSSLGASLSWGKTFYLHKQTLFGMMKVGLDWSWLDLTYAQHKIDTSSDFGVTDDDSNESATTMTHLAFGMQLGPSVTVNPVDHLKLSLYLRVTPSFAMIGADEVYGGYSTYCNLGLSVAWRVLSVGFEQRWGKINADGNDKFNDSTTRFYFGFRF